jgi:hypothetical protein
MTKRKKIAISAAVFFLCLLLFCALILPIIVKSKTIEAIQQATGRTVRLESVSINPLTLSVGIKGFAVEERGGGPFISIGSVRTSLSLASIYRRALILSKIEVDSPQFSITRSAPNQYNFTDIIERIQADKKPKSEKESLFSLNNILIRNGSADFSDLAIAGGRKHTVRSLEIGIPFISNIPYLEEQYTDPKLSAVVNGALFSFAGKMKPLSKSLETSVNIDLKQLNLPELVAYSPVKPPADLKSGTLTINTDLSYRVSSDKKPELILKGVVRLNDIAVQLKNGQPLVKLPLMEAKASKLEVFAKQFVFDSIRLDRLELYVSRDASGHWMYEQLLKSDHTAETEENTETKQSAAKAVQQPLVQISAFDLTNSSIHFSDNQPKSGFTGSLNDIDLNLKKFSSDKDKTAEYELSLLVDNEADFSSEGTFSVFPLAAKASADLSGLNVLKGFPYLTQFLTAPVKGTLDLSADASFTPDAGLTIENGTLTLKGLSARYGDKEGLDLAMLSVNGAAFRQKDNRLDIAEVKLSRGNVSASREADGSLSLMSLFRQSGGKPASPAPTPSGKAVKKNTPAPAPRPLAYRLKQFQADRLNFSFTDKSREEKPRFNLRGTKVSLANLAGPKFIPAQLRFSATLNKNTSLSARGDITPLPFRYKGNLALGRLAIMDFEDYFPDNLNVIVIGGNLDSNVNVDIALKNGKPIGTFKGRAGVRGFHSIDTVAEEDLLTWESLQLDEFQGNLEPFSLSVNQIALNGVYSRIIVRKDGELNLQNLVEKPSSADIPASKNEIHPQNNGTAATMPAPQPKIAAAKGPITINTITIQGGTLAFSDFHLPQQFVTTFYNLGGRVSGLSSEESKFAEVDLRGNLENHSPLQITGTVNPLRDDLFVDLKVSFRDIELSPITPYSGTYLGYTVEKGKLSLELKYHIEKKELSSENKIFIDQFTFGNKVESDKATSLPVRLGLALLKDRKGEIHLDVPVTGRTDDPKFSIWRLVFQVLKNLLVKAATSPFSLLSSLFGEGADLSTITFGLGASTLPSSEETKLAALAKALADRPALKMELKGYVDRDKDAEGYRLELLERKIRNEKLLSLVKVGALKEGANSESIKVLPEDYTKYLKTVYKKEKFPKPRNAFGLVKDLPDAEMRKLIITNTVVGDANLQTLAQERTKAVMEYLVNKGSIASERIFLKKDDIYKTPEKDTTVRSRVELNAIAQ